MAEHKKNAPDKRKRLLNLFADKRWHDHTELAAIGGVRYSARVLELKRLGYNIESKGDQKEGKEYRLNGKRTPPVKKVKALLDEADVNDILGWDQLSVNATIVLENALESFVANRDKL